MRKPSMIVAAVGLLLAALSGASAAACRDRYHAADGAAPLSRPSRELADTLAQAEAGDAKEQRKLASYYAAGYLVSRCDEKALHWYRQAAFGGDEVAKKWLVRHARFAQLHSQGECIGSSCSGAGGEGRQQANFTLGQNGHYSAPVTINGITETGLIDTGATTIAMSAETARRFGIDPQKGARGVAQTASGTVNVTSVVLPLVNVGGIELRNIRVTVGIQGQMLIGMSILGKLNVKMTPGMLTLEK